VPVRGDASRLHQVVGNLLSNASNYSPSGTLVQLRLLSGTDEAVLTVADHGIGIEREMFGKIFELFVQADQRLDRPRGGLGVGLSLARSVVELHGGTIDVESEGRNRGSTFTVRLPLQTHAILPRAPRSLHPVHSTGCRVVVLEDQQDSREMLRVLLEKHGHVVIDSADGADGVEIIEREHPDVALVDIGLPVVDGYEIARQVRSRRHLDDVVMIALTGYGAPSDLAFAREAGFDHHIVKPAELSRILELLQHQHTARRNA
jgi:CheY-like chemotaxis protein